MVLVVSFAAIGFVYFFDKTSFKTFFRLRASREENDWNALGPVLAIGFTLGTTMYMSFAVTSKHGVINGQFWKLLPLVLLFAATNAWSEEIISRFVIVAGLYGKLSPSVICWIGGDLWRAAFFWNTQRNIRRDDGRFDGMDPRQIHGPRLAMAGAHDDITSSLYGVRMLRIPQELQPPSGTMRPQNRPQQMSAKLRQS